MKTETRAIHLWLMPIAVWLALLILLGLSVGSAYVQLGAFNTPTNLAIAAVKVALVVVFFMQLDSSSALLQTTTCPRVRGSTVSGRSTSR